MDKTDKDLDPLDSSRAIAVIGMAGRFPGARTLEEFRRNLEAGVESITVLSDRELLEAGVDPDLLANPRYVKAVPLLEDADMFDAAFFGYSPREAAIMDPQQRLFLECAWEALEDAGRAGGVAGSATGVFSGAGGIMSTYLLSDTHFTPQLTGTTASLQHVGNDKDYLSTRVSYKFDLRGPSMTVQSACSTSLVAVHVACQSLVTGECDMALAGGTTVRVPQRTGYLYKEGNVFSRDGHCRAFDAEAEGTVFGSGIGVVVLKRLGDAIRDGDAIRAVIRATAISNDGGTKSSYWAPHAEGQADAMRRAVASARIDPSTIGYVEGHGTATRVGDPTEIRALNDAFGSAAGGRCAIGSVKSNIGHPESAAGVAGLIKAVLSVEHDVLYPSLHYSKPNPLAGFGERFYVNTVLQPWPSAAHPRRAGVNSLGIGGTNAFAIVEQAPHAAIAPAAERPSELLVLSARSPEALDALTGRFSQYLAGPPDARFGDICYTTQVGRAHFGHRRAVVASSVQDGARALSDATRTVSGHADPHHQLRVAFLFTGQGSQYAGMAQELYRTSPAFHALFDRCATTVAPWLDRPLADVVYPSAAPGDGKDLSAPIHQTAYTQVALFAVEYALATLWRSWGVQPSVLIGHSVGEIVAACVAGVFSLDDALRLVAARGRLMQALPQGGGMAAVKCDAAVAAASIAPFRATLAIAAVNGPADVVLSGRREDLDAVTARLVNEGVTVVPLRVSHAFHSPLMEPMLEEFAAVARSIAFSPPSLPLVSNVSGRLAGAEVTTPEYWVRHVREAVRFADSIVTAADQGVDVFLEIGPAPVLVGLGRQSAPAGTHAWLASLRSGQPDWRQMSESLATLYTRGAGIDWHAFHAHDAAPRRVHLPTYPFERQRYWIDPPAAPSSIAAGSAPQSLLGHRLRLPGAAEVRFEASWSPQGPGYLTDHRLFERVVVPGASHLAMVLSGLRAVHGPGTAVVEDVVFPQALTLDDDGRCTAQLVLSREAGRGDAFTVISILDGDDDTDAEAWRTHATGRIDESVAAATDAPPAPLAEWQARVHAHQTGESFYATFWQAGYHLRGSFRWVARTWTGTGEVLSEFSWPELPDDAADYVVYPSLIDACFQSVFSDRAGLLLREGAVFVPFSIGRLTCYGSPAVGTRLWCHATVTDPEDARRSGVDADISLCDDSGRLVLRIERCQLREVSREALVRARDEDLRDATYEVEWVAEPRRSRPSLEAVAPGVWIVFADRSPISSLVIDGLREQHQRCVRVDPGAAFALLDTDHYEADATSAADLQRVASEIAQQAGGRCRGIVHLWSLDTVPMHDAAIASSQERALGSALHLVQAISRLDWTTPPRFWLVTRGAQPVEAAPLQLAVEQSPLWGFGRVVALEHPELQCVRVDLDPSAQDASSLLDDLLAPDQQDQIAFRRGSRFVPRLVRSPLSARGSARPAAATAPARPVQVRLTDYGRFEQLTLKPLTRRPPGAGEVEVEVRAAGLNFRDVLNALGLLQDHYAAHLGVTSATAMTFGFESAGTVVAVGDGVTDLSAGDEVVTMGTHDALGSFVTLPRAFVARKPSLLTFEEAATLPLAFLTAYHGLHGLAGLKAGERVLVHAAAGGVGQACVQWARHVGAEVYATASPAKWDVLRAAGVRHVMSSRTLDFAAAVKALTSGKGVDVVVNALSGEFVAASFAALTHGGRFVELGKRDVWSPDEARARRPDVAYYPFDLMEIARRDPGAIASLLGDMSRLLSEGVLKPLPHRVFPVESITDAFRFMAEAKHVGKIVIAMPARTARHATAPVVRADASYLITGGLGALGLETARRLVDEGVRYLALTGRRAPTSDAHAAIARLRDAGATVVTFEADVAQAADVARVLGTMSQTLPPLRGIVHAAGLLDDGVVLQQTWERFQRVLAPKVSGTWNLHVQTQEQPLDFFVCFSSIASLVGNPGQSNYAAANAFMDALAHRRRAQGLVALSINWGPWDEIGMAAAPAGQRQRRLGEQGFRPIAPTAGLDLFSRLLSDRRAQVGVMPINWTEYLRHARQGAAFFGKLAAPPSEAAAAAPDFRQQLEQSADLRAALSLHVRTVVGAVLGKHDIMDVDERSRLFDLGLESLMAVELRGRFEQSIGCPLRPTLLFDYPTIEALVEHLAGKFAERVAPPAAAAPLPAGASPADASPDLSDLGEDEIAERLAQELLLSSKAQEP